MLASVMYDVGGVLVGIGVNLIILTPIISVVEAVVMFLLKWDKFWRCLWVSLLMNAISTIFGIGSVVVGFLFSDLSLWLQVVLAFLLSVLLEGGVLMLMKRNAARLNWLTSLYTNIASYLLVIVPLVAWLNA